MVAEKFYNLAVGQGFTITKERLYQYKQNVEMLNETLPTKVEMMTDREILDEMIKEEPTILDAKKRGIQVTSAEVEEMITK